MKPSTWPMRIARLEKRVSDAAGATSIASLTPWQKAQVARHPDRPHCLDYVATLIQRLSRRSRATDPIGDDSAIVGASARFRVRPVAHHR